MLFKNKGEGKIMWLFLTIFCFHFYILKKLNLDKYGLSAAEHFCHSEKKSR